MSLKLAIFDVDGTLVDSQAHIVAAMEQAFASFGHAAPARGDILSIVGLSLPQAMARLAPELAAGARAGLVDAYKDSFAALRGGAGSSLNSPLYPGARAALDRLAARDDVLLGVATGKSRRGLRHVLAAHGLEGMFQTVQTADDHPSKPHPAMIGAALDDTGTDAGNAVMIGDTSFDIDMARAAGVAAVGVSWGYHPAAALTDAGAADVVDRFAALIPALDLIWHAT